MVLVLGIEGWVHEVRIQVGPVGDGIPLQLHQQTIGGQLRHHVVGRHDHVVPRGTRLQLGPQLLVVGEEVLGHRHAVLFLELGDEIGDLGVLGIGTGRDVVRPVVENQIAVGLAGGTLHGGSCRSRGLRRRGGRRRLRFTVATGGTDQCQHRQQQ